MANDVTIRLSVQGITQAVAGIKQFQTAFTSLRNSIPAIAAIGAVAGLTALIKQAIDFADAAGKMAQKTGIAVDALTALQYSAKLSEISTEQLQTSIKKFSEELVRTGKYTADVEEELIKVADQFRAMPDGVYKSTRAVELFGKAGLDMIPWLNRGGEAIRREMEEARLFGVVIGPRFAENADQFNDNLERMQTLVQGLALKMADALLPTLIDLTEKVIALGKEVSGYFDNVAFGTEVLLQNAKNVSASWKDYWDAFWSPGEAMAKAAAQVMAERIGDDLRRKLGDSVKKALAEPVFDPADLQRAIDMRERLQANTAKFFPGLSQITTKNGAGLAPTGDVLAEDMRFRKELDQIDKLAIAYKDKNALIRAEEEFNQATLDDIKSKYHQKEQDRILAEERARHQAWQASLQVGSDFFGALANIAILFGKKGFAAYKAFAIAQAIMDTIRGAQAAYASASAVPFVGPVLGPIAAGVATVAGVARVAQIAATNPSGYMAGGYTGDGSPSSVAGVVHKREFVVNATATERARPMLEALNAGRGGGSPDVSVPSAGVTIGFINDRASLREWFKTDSGMRRIMIDMFTGAKLEMGIA